MQITNVTEEVRIVVSFRDLPRIHRDFIIFYSTVFLPLSIFNRSKFNLREFENNQLNKKVSLTFALEL